MNVAKAIRQDKARTSQLLPLMTEVPSKLGACWTAGGWGEQIHPHREQEVGNRLSFSDGCKALLALGYSAVVVETWRMTQDTGREKKVVIDRNWSDTGMCRLDASRRRHSAKRMALALLYYCRLGGQPGKRGCRDNSIKSLSVCALASWPAASHWRSNQLIASFAFIFQIWNPFKPQVEQLITLARRA